MAFNMTAQGAARAQEQAELRRVLPPDVIAAEPRAAMTRWLRYRFMSPMECTQRFAEDYTDGFRSTFGIKCDFDPQPGSDDFIALWKMRQSADRWRVPYSIYLDVCFSFNRRNAEKFRRPHLHFDKLSNSRRWSEKRHAAVRDHGPSMLTRLSDMPQYHRQHYIGLPAQDSVCGYARHVALSTKQWLHIASSVSITHNMVPLEIMLRDLKEPDLRQEVVGRLRDHVKSGYLTREPAPELGDASLLQSCFGWQPEDSHLSQPCVRCPQAADCRAASNMFTRSSAAFGEEVTSPEVGGHPSHPPARSRPF